MCLEETQDYLCDLASPARAREFCVSHLAPALGEGPAADDLLEAAVLIVSELMTNAVNAGSHAAVLEYALHRSYLRLSVRDDAPGRPALQQVGPRDDHGRGLKIVQSLTPRWGVVYSEQTKEVWAELPVPAALTAYVQCELSWS